MPVTARARVRLWPMVKPVTTNSRSFSRRARMMKPRMNDMWSIPVKMCIIPIFTNSKKLAFCSLPPLLAAAASRVRASLVNSCSTKSPFEVMTWAKVTCELTRSKNTSECSFMSLASGQAKLNSKRRKPGEAAVALTGPERGQGLSPFSTWAWPAI